MGHTLTKKMMEQKLPLILVKRKRNSRGQFTDGIGDPTIRLGALPILKIKEAFETGDMDAQARTLLATRLAGLIALVTQVLEHNSRKQREKNKE